MCAPSWVPAPCLYACLIGQKQHAWLCSQGNGETLEWAGGPGLSPYVFIIFSLSACLLFSPTWDFFFFDSSSLSPSLLLGNVWPQACLLPPLCQQSLSSASLESQCELASCCRCRLARPRCFYRVVTRSQPTFSRWLNNAAEPFDLQFRRIPGRQHQLLCSRFLLARITFSTTAGTAASYGKLTRPFSWSAQRCLLFCGLRGENVCLPRDFLLHQHQWANCH